MASRDKGKARSTDVEADAPASPEPAPPPADAATHSARISRALLESVADQSSQVQGKVEACVVGLSAVNGVLSPGGSPQVPLADVREAIVQNKEIETKVQECADELATINGVLHNEIHERAALDRQLDASAVALQQSQAAVAAATYRSLHDALTGLPNATLFNDRLKMALSQAKRHAWKLAVMFIDLDKFKDINDRLGHAAGDEVLKAIAMHLQELVRSGDSIARRSGDEFLFLMLEADNEKDVAAMARTIIVSIGNDCRMSEGEVRVRPSIGIALYPEHGTTAVELLGNADRAMYTAKQRPDGFAFFSRALPV